ncbi:D-methionine transport system permease protein [Acetoanaerobium pronyense]|uniref:D-methionine transport system permease protein n=1 Tax=Acetoanaerobium pronyense TaxID=1482736 RepID=A0ABS4KI72_9FIRM|nr:methionine ABC transporter permease [Acetoanaerobium pronyense]MBP2026836.1 D-methionine transport system permease protein [Acetoanaerobium pronyense]
MLEIQELVRLMFPSILQTLYMVFVSTLFTILLGMPLGIILVTTSKGHIMENSTIYEALSYIVNIGRSLPFVILMIFIFPFTRLLVGTSIGTNAAIVPLVVAAIPFFARVVETSLLEVDSGLIEAALSMGAGEYEIITRVLIPESLASLVLGITITIINILGYSAMAGAVGGGGIGDLAIRYGYHRFQTNVMIGTVVLLILMVQIIQTLGNTLSKKLNTK